VIDGKKSRPWLIILAFAVSIIIFTLGLQYLVSQFGVRPNTLTKISAGILILFGIVLLFPQIRAKLMSFTGIEKATHDAQSNHGSGFGGDILL
jgi:ABC-type nickel/cobalt efflux system permease component RcnA